MNRVDEAKRRLGLAEQEYRQAGKDLIAMQRAVPGDILKLCVKSHDGVLTKEDEAELVSLVRPIAHRLNELCTSGMPLDTTLRRILFGE